MYHFVISLSFWAILSLSYLLNHLEILCLTYFTSKFIYLSFSHTSTSNVLSTHSTCTTDISRLERADSFIFPIILFKLMPCFYLHTNASVITLLQCFWFNPLKSSNVDVMTSFYLNFNFNFLHLMVTHLDPVLILHQHRI